MISQHVYGAYLIGAPDVELSLIGGSITLDDTQSPHVQADIDVAWPGHWELVPDNLPTAYGGPVWVPDDEVLEALDPRLSPRVRVTVDASYPTFSTSRFFDLGVRDYDPSQTSRVVSLTLASDEDILSDYAQGVDDSTPFTLASSLRAVIDYALSKASPGAVLNAAWYDSFEHGVSDWTPAANTSRIVGSTAPRSGAHTLAAFRTSTAGEFVVTRAITGLVIGRSYTAQAWVSAVSNALTNVNVGIIGKGTGVGFPVTAAQDWLRMSFAFTATATTHTIRLAATATGSGTSHAARWDDAAIIDNTLPTNDADLTPVWPVTNLMPNPAARAVVGNWIAGGVNGNLARETGHSGAAIGGEDTTVTTAFLTTFTGNSGLGQGGAVSQTASAVPYAPVQPGKVYTVYTRVHASVARNVKLAAQIFGSDGAVLNGGAVLIPSQALPAGAWTWILGTVRMPANAARIGPFLYPADGTQWVNGNLLRTTKWMVHEGSYPVRVPWFDGATPSDATYDYVASGAAHASATTRTPKVDATDPDALIWPAGVSALDFLRPLVQKAGYRLVCDEQRQWTLRDENYVAEGSLNVRYGVNLIDGSARISRDSGLWFDGRVTRYKWTDRDGLEQQRDDVFVPAGATKVDLVVLENTPYPGPGRSEYAVRRAKGRGREVTVSQVADWRGAAEQSCTIHLDGAPPQLGSASRIQFTLGPGDSRDRMTITARTTDTPADSWLLGTPDETWLSATSTETWMEAG